ncbi:superoxide dismutase family protein [Aquincola sp. J276]|uniref:superoxide dismutase family protein n=1 Tax=Aquincola sp. J276 TaxID=2898432 RepID=UPI002151C1E0|nr:superoxide dismutase family protein [Aquincola sp. J276]MCR5865090.1 superoxide dismutase family protein [Aquincola sp. J276]
MTPMSRSTAFHALAASAAAALLAGCAGGGMHGHHGMAGTQGSPVAVAQLAPTQGSTTTGTVQFFREGEHVMAVARVSGLKPGAEHGFHVHEKGDCSASDAMSAGGHFNPEGHPHGARGSGGAHHAGDMPNLKADAAGEAELRVHLPGLGIGGGAADILGKAVIVHANADDYRSQPTGNAGARLACGVIAAR